MSLAALLATPGVLSESAIAEKRPSRKAKKRKKQKKKPAPAPKPAPKAPEEKPEEPVKEAVDVDRPWSKGVSAPDQENALKIFNEGNTYFETSQYALAAEQYRDALQSWKHPAIHFNMMVCLINLGQPKDAYEHLHDSLKFGAAPLGQEVYERAVNYQTLLEKQVTKVTIKSSQKDVQVSLDGKPLFKSPGETTLVALPGSHQLVASKEGFLTHTEVLNFVGGEDASSEVKLIPLAEAQNYRLERRWARWKPWTVLGGGLATMAAGMGTRFLASSDFNRYDNDVTILCPPQGCAADELPQSTKDVLSRAELEDTISSGLLIAGGAAVATGAVLLYFNRERSIKESFPTIAPMVTPDGGGVSLMFDID